jgi:hypothetical protein
LQDLLFAPLALLVTIAPMKLLLNQVFALKDTFAALVQDPGAHHLLRVNRALRAQYHLSKDCLTKHYAMYALLELFAASKQCFRSLMRARVQRDMYAVSAPLRIFSSRQSVLLDLFVISEHHSKTNSRFPAGLDTLAQREPECRRQPG